MTDNEDQNKSAESQSDESADTSTRQKLSPLTITFLAIIFVIGIPLLWFASDDELRCQICRDTNGQTCIGVIRAGCANMTHSPPIGMEPENLRKRK